MNESNHDLPNSLLNLTDRTPAGVTLLEQEVLDEYTRLLNNMNHVRGHAFPSLRPLKLGSFESDVTETLLPFAPA